MSKELPDRQWMDVKVNIFRNVTAQFSNLIDIAKQEILFFSKTTILSLKYNDSSLIRNVIMWEWYSGMNVMEYVYLNRMEALESVWLCGLNLLDISGLKTSKEFIGED